MPVAGAGAAVATGPRRRSHLRDRAVDTAHAVRPTAAPITRRPIAMLRICLAALLLACVLGPAVAGDADRRADPARGYAVTKPAGWRFVDAPVADAAPSRTGSLVTIRKHGDDFSGINPNFSIALKEFGEVPPAEAKWFFETTIASIQAMQGATLTTPVHEVNVGGRPGLHAVIDAATTAPDGGEHAGTVEFWMVPAGDLYFLMAGSYPQADPASRAEFQGIVESLQLAGSVPAK